METFSSELDILTTNHSLDELKTALKQIKPAKAFGPDNIPAIIWKDDHFYDLLLKLCNYYAFEDKHCPSYWRKSQIIPVPKKGDLSLVTNYRGISLFPIAAKFIINLFYRLLPYIDPLLNQNGFRAGRSTLRQISRRYLVAIVMLL